MDTLRPSVALGARMAAGDELALGEAYRLLGSSVRAYARRSVGPADADDIVQRVFLDVWTSAARLDPSRPLEAWVFTIAKRRIADHLRRRRHDVVPLDDGLHRSTGAAGDVAGASADAVTVRALLSGLSSEQRQVIELAYFGGRTQSEIADGLGIPLGTVKARTARGLRKLAVLLREGERS